ncbi:MAG: DUF4838 domain-containing protein [Phycisphaerae bacterium]
MNKFYKRMWVISIVFLMQSAVAQAAVTIVKDGRSEYSIVVAKDAIPAERFAAEELALHIKQMSGADLKIIDDTGPLPKHAILLGRPRYLVDIGVKSDWLQLGKEGYRIRTLGSHLIIAGGRPRGTMYGVYDLLQEHWGCRWFTMDTSVVPRKSTLNVPDLNAIHRPVFEFRDVMVAGGSYGQGCPGQYDESDIRDDLYAARNHWNFKIRAFQNKDERYGGSFRILYGPSHNYRWLVDPDKYSTEHPEYYALSKGKRLSYKFSVNEAELCLTNPDVVRVAAQTISGWLREHPDADMCFIGQSDTPQYCKCDNCTASRKRYGGWDGARRVQLPAGLPTDYWTEFGGFAGWQIEFINKVAETVEKEFPNARIGTYAYWHARKPPRGIKPHKNVVIWYCPFNAGMGGQFHRCDCHSVDTGPINDDFESFGEELGEWTRIAKQVYVYDYWLGTWMGQPINIPTLRQTMRFYRKLGVEGIDLDGIRGIPAGFEWLTFWLWSQLAWNPDFDVDQGIDEFCAAYYGAASPYIKQYMNLTGRPDSYEMTSVQLFQSTRDRTKRYTDDPYRPIKFDKLKNCQLGFRGRVMTADAINRGYDLFGKAMKAVVNDTKTLKHVEYTRMGLQFAMLEWLPRTDPRLNGEVERLVQLAKELDLQAVGYRGMTPDQYRDAVKKKIKTGAPLYPPRPSNKPLVE